MCYYVSQRTSDDWAIMSPCDGLFLSNLHDCRGRKIPTGWLPFKFKIKCVCVCVRVCVRARASPPTVWLLTSSSTLYKFNHLTTHNETHQVFFPLQPMVWFEVYTTKKSTTYRVPGGRGGGGGRVELVGGAEWY